MASKRSRMTVAQFIPLYMAAVDAGVTREEFAKKLGVKPDTIYQRVYDLNTNHGAGLPQLRCEGRSPLSDQVKQALAAYRGGRRPEEKQQIDELEALLKG